PQVAAVDNVTASDIDLDGALTEIAAVDPYDAIRRLLADVNAFPVSLKRRDVAIDGAQLARSEPLCEIDRLFRGGSTCAARNRRDEGDCTDHGRKGQQQLRFVHTVNLCASRLPASSGS